MEKYNKIKQNRIRIRKYLMNERFLFDPLLQSIPRFCVCLRIHIFWIIKDNHFNVFCTIRLYQVLSEFIICGFVKVNECKKGFSAVMSLGPKIDGCYYFYLLLRPNSQQPTYISQNRRMRLHP